MPPEAAVPTFAGDRFGIYGVVRLVRTEATT